MVEDEDPEETAIREAFEECGARLGRLDAIGAPFSSPGVSSERIDLFLAVYAADDRSGPAGGLGREHVTVEEVPLDLLWAWVEQRRIEDLKTLALILTLRVRRPELFTPAGSSARR
jgi:8-oxo-dGTP pyrophosphatase MutT (NUDIX family)